MESGATISAPDASQQSAPHFLTQTVQRIELLLKHDKKGED
jgi:hypothetical protein